MIATVSRKAHFNAAHRLHNPEWNAEKNTAIFGVCNNPHFHGHNYELIVSVTGPIHPDTGYVMDTKVLSDLIKEEVENRMDHKNLNVEVSPFNSGTIPSAENIAVFIWNALREKISEDLSLKVTLYETPRNYVEYSGE
jgi:6-pyruvoyltetrahydropterin/6-carboxytetrahydropterin synthase